MGKKDDKDPFGPPRRQDPYVSGYRGGGDPSQTGQSDQGKEGCGEATAKMAIGITTAFLLARLALRSLKSR
jgi:hypothetical protein